jgi:hypothetical protein
VSDKARLKQLEQRYADHASGKNPLPPEQSLKLRAEIDQLSTKINPNQTNAWGDYSPAEKQYIANKQAAARQFGNNLGIMLLGPVAGGPAALGREFNASEATIENLGRLGLDAVGLKGAQGTKSISPVGNGKPMAQNVVTVPVPKPVAAPVGRGVAVEKKFAANDFISKHAYDKHSYQENKSSEGNKTRYGKDVNPNEIREQTLNNPDKVTNLYDKEGVHYVTKYEKDFGYNISQANTPTSASRVFINHLNPSQSTQFPFFRNP